MLRAAWREVRGQAVLGEFGIRDRSIFLCRHTQPKLWGGMYLSLLFLVAGKKYCSYIGIRIETGGRNW